MLLLSGGEGERFDTILREAEARGTPLRLADRREFDRLFPGQTHQGVAASYNLRPEADLDDLLGSGSTARLMVMLDGLEDPQNVGAVIRSAEVFGAAGVIIPARRAAGVTPVTVKASAGAALRLPIATVVNLAQTIRAAKNAGYWVYGLDPAGGGSLWEEEFPNRLCLVFGAEGRGLARLTRDLCDRLISVPQAGRIGSLNVSACAAVALAELLRRREKDRGSVDLAKAGL